MTSLKEKAEPEGTIAGRRMLLLALRILLLISFFSHFAVLLYLLEKGILLVAINTALFCGFMFVVYSLKEGLPKYWIRRRPEFSSALKSDLLFWVHLRDGNTGVSLIFKNPQDVGFLYIDREKNALCFEGLESRWRVSGAALEAMRNFRDDELTAMDLRFEVEGELMSPMVYFPDPRSQLKKAGLSLELVPGRRLFEELKGRALATNDGRG